MKRTVPRLEGLPRDVARGELIGLGCTIAQSNDPGLVGRSGMVVDETLHTLHLREPGGQTIIVPKVACQFRFETPRGSAQLPGAAIEFRSDERTKKVR